ncbi:MAG: hypothetical protein O3B31_14195 [Chloroflexi bacterium]|nr:hypothetical protein [Chloroflexota bacterium]MDA1004472.1 hypothetical protein [Chloroflexota bacterium]
MNLPEAIGPLRTRDPRHLRAIATAAIAPVVAVLVLFVVGEAGGGDLSGLQHVVQLAPLVLIVAAAWRFPTVGGGLLVVLSLVLIVGYPVWALDREISPLGIVLVEALLLLPPLASGLLFLAAGRMMRVPSAT